MNLLSRAVLINHRNRRIPIIWQALWLRTLSSNETRSKFIEFFKHNGHEYYPSSSVIPKKGDGTYFTNSGMNQFKPIFLGQCDPSSKLWDLKRIVNSQKCIRVGGKHNDLEDVGHDFTHHTFFEMMGSWSFGDYFKREACTMAYELLHHHFSIPIDRLYFTYFGGDTHMGLPADEECYHIWASLGIPKTRILPFGAKDNFWDMGLTGPCGPCTEIHYDHKRDRCAGSEVNSGLPDVVEIWNLVFMQYNRNVDQSLNTLPSHHVDTGMGLERMVAVMNGQSDNYKTDLFLPLFDIIQEVAECPPYSGQFTPEDTALRILADHSRMLTIAISDRLLPSNDNLGHKLRIILHKCIQLCYKHFKTDPNTLLPALTTGVVSSLEGAYPELTQNQEKVIDVIKSAISHYDKMIDQGNRNFEKMMSRMRPTNVLSGQVILALEKGHFGNAMALETINEMAQKHGLELNMEEYQHLVQEDSRLTSTSSIPVNDKKPVDSLVDQLIELGKPQTNDTFKYDFVTNHGTYDFTRMTKNTSSCILGILGNEVLTDQQIKIGQKGEVILDKTCFYSEAGGQDADKGYLCSETGMFRVEDVQNHRSYVIHKGQVEKGYLTVGQVVTSEILTSCRAANMRNHTATHVLNAALLDLLPNTQQEGSNISPHQFTFDFLALSKLDEITDIRSIQSKVKDIINEAHPVTCTEISFEEAKHNPSIRWNQNEDYPDQVRVITIGDLKDGSPISMELCGGTHVLNTEDIGNFCITNLSAKSQHVKRVTCVVGQQAAQAHVNGEIVESVCDLLEHLHKFVQISAELASVQHKDLTLLARTMHLDKFLEGNLALAAIQKGIDTLLARTLQVKDSLQKQIDELPDGFEKTVEDFKKMVPILDLLGYELTHLLENETDSDELVKLMKQLIDIIHRCQHIELLPKTSRHTAHKCVQNMEHKVQTMVNARKAQFLKKLLEQVENDGMPEELNILNIPDLDVNPRQVLKMVNKNELSKPVVIAQNTKPVLNVVMSLPFDYCKFKPNKEIIGDLTNALQGFSQVKAKISSQSDKRMVIKISVKGSELSDLGVALKKWSERR